MKTLRRLGLAALCLVGCSDNPPGGSSMDAGVADMVDPLRTDVPVGTVPKGLVLGDA